MAHTSEYEVEDIFIDRLEGIGYKFIKLDNYDDVLANSREQLAKFNAKKLAEKGHDASFSDAEFNRIMIHVDNHSVYESAKILRDKYVLQLDNGESVYIDFFSGDTDRNIYQVTHQVTMDKAHKDDGSDFPEWEEKNVEDVCSVSTGKGNTQDKVDTGAYRFYVRSPIIEHSDSYLFDEEAVITVGDGVGTGKVFHYVKGKYNLHQRCYRMYDFRGVIGKYFYYFFSTNFYRRVKSMFAKTSVDSVRMEMITKMKISVPCLAEQQKIADCLSSLDEVIEKQKATLAAWEELKKGLLQQMFV